MRTQTTGQHPEIASLKQQASRHAARDTGARRALDSEYGVQSELYAAIENTIDQITPYQRLRINRWLEAASLTVLGTAEVVVAETVVQALALTATATNLVAVAVGGAATGLAWMGGHEWANSRDPQMAAAGQSGWFRIAMGASVAFLVANLGVRIYYGVLEEKADHLGTSLVSPLLSGLLFTTVTAALMVVAAFVSAHVETAKQAQLRARLRRVRARLRSLKRAGASHLRPARDDLRFIREEGTPPAA
jgi:hypothetical protein